MLRLTRGMAAMTGMPAFHPTFAGDSAPRYLGLMITRAFDVELSITRRETSHAVAVVVEHAVRARIARALGAWLACWLLAALSVFIHILHLFLVPGFLVAGVVLGIKRLRERSSLVRLEGPCPRCKVPRTREAMGAFRDACRVHCDTCGHSATLRVLGPRADGP